MKSAIIPFLCLLLGTAAGWFSASDSTDAPAAPVPSRLSPRQIRERSLEHARAIPSDIAALLAPIHTARNPQERMRAVIHLARTLPVSELARWFDSKWLTLRDGDDLNVFKEITCNRWLAEDPVGIMERALSQNWQTFDDLADRWARTDPDTALAYLQSIKAPKSRQRFERSMVGALAISHPAEVLAMIQVFTDPTGRPDQWSTAFKVLAQYHPELLESAELPAILRDAARIMLVRTGLEKDFGGELARLSTSANGLSDFSHILQDERAAGKFSKSILAHIDQFPADWLSSLARESRLFIGDEPEAWLNLDLEALGMSEVDANKYRDTAWRLLAEKDPAKVLASFSDLDGDFKDFEHYLTIALNALNRTSPEKAAQWLAYFKSRTDSEEFKQQLQMAIVSDAPVAQKTTAKSVLEKLQERKPRDVLTTGSLYNEFLYAPPSVQKEVTSEIMKMEPKDLSQMGYANVQYSLPDFPKDLQANLISSMIEHPPAEVNEDQKAGLIDATVQLASNWAKEDPATAVRWVGQLPAGEPRKWALRNVAVRWMPYDPPAVQAWLNQLPALDRTDVQEFLATEGSGR